MALTRPRAYQIYDIDYKQAVRVVSVSNVTLAGGAPNSVDGVNLSLNDRVLVVGQSSTVQNGIYYVTTVGTGANGTWTRSVDTDTTGELLSGTIVMVTEGATYADTQWKLTTDDPITIGVTGLTFVQNYLANSISYGQTSFAIGSSNANATVSVAGTSNVAVFGTNTITLAGNLLPTSNITYSLGSTSQRWKDLWISNSTIYLGNITLGATDTQLTVSGANVVTSTANGAVSTTGNVTGGNLLTGGLISATGNITGNYILGNGSQLTGLPATYSNTNVAAYLASGTNSSNIITTANVTGGNITTTGAISLSGNIYTGNILTNGYYYANGVAFAGGGGGGTPTGSNTNVQFNDNGAFGGTAGFTFNKTTNAVATTGTLSATSNITGGNLLTGGLVSATGNITSSANIAGGNLTITGASQAGSYSTGGNVTGGNLLTGGLISATSTITSAANITGGNLLTSGIVSAASYIGSLVSVTANITGGNLLTGGLISATGNITSAANISGGNVIITGAGQATSYSASGNITAGNFLTSGLISATGNITSAANISGGNVIITGAGQASSYSASGNITAGNFLTSGLISATGNITSAANISGGNLLATTTVSAASYIGSVVSVTANITGGNLISAGTITAAGNIATSGANGVANIGAVGAFFNTVHAKATSAQYADVAEFYASDENYEPGTVVIFGGDAEVTVAYRIGDDRVAGVVSTNPAYIMNAGIVSTYSVPVALTGRVPTRVVGPVRKGNMMVSAGNGRAMACTTPSVGTVIGKAIENFDGDYGTIEIVVGRL